MHLHSSILVTLAGGPGGSVEDDPLYLIIEEHGAFNSHYHGPPCLLQS